MNYPTTQQIDDFSVAANARFNPVIDQQAAAQATVGAICINCGKSVRDWSQKYCDDFEGCDQRAAFKQ
jgi:hypothetical protein